MLKRLNWMKRLIKNLLEVTSGGIDNPFPILREFKDK